MTTVRFGFLAFALTTTLTLFGCGGGGGGGTPVGVATLSGSVLLNNGSTSNLGGIRLFNPNSGKTVTTAPDGSFSFGSVPAGTITLRVTGPVSAIRASETNASGEDGDGDAEEGGDGEGEAGEDGEAGDGEHEGDDDIGDDDGKDANDGDGDDDGDNSDVGDDDCDMEGVTDGEDVEIHLTIRDGVIETVEFGQEHNDERECEGGMSRCETSDDPDIIGRVRAESRDDRDRLIVDVEHATPGRSLKAFVINADGGEASLGTRAVGLEGRAEWASNSAEGDGLPFGVSSVGSLVGFRVEVRDASDAATALLCGEVNELPHSAGDPASVVERGRELLARVSAGENTEAHVSIEHRTGHEAGDEFGVDVEGLDSGAVVDVWLEIPDAPGTYAKVGSLTIGGEHEGELELSTREGGSLPFDVTTVAHLVGLHIQLRNPANAVLFSGIVPAMVSH